MASPQCTSTSAMPTIAEGHLLRFFLLFLPSVLLCSIFGIRFRLFEADRNDFGSAGFSSSTLFKEALTG
jgi:hypothetical protein